MTAAPAKRTRPHYDGDPTLAKVMRQPKWIGALLLAMLVAAVFAWLGQWQLGHAVTLDSEQSVDVETVRPLYEATAPGSSVTDQVAGTVLEASGAFVAGDFSVVEQRSNGGQEGAWVVGHLATVGPPTGHLAVAIGWAPDVETAEAAIDQIEQEWAGAEVTVEGRYMPSDAPVRPASGDDPERLLSMAPAQLVNLWQPFEGLAFPGFLVLHPGEWLDGQELAAIGLDPVDSVAPLPVEKVNWLNLFYAVEWVVFAGFAVFFWYRLARDDWERIHEMKLLEAGSPALPGTKGSR